MIKSGIITKLTGGFYYVEVDNTIHECKAKGVFRNKKTSPVVGDYVDIDIKEDNTYCSIEKIHDRKNFLLRPPIANIDNLFIVSSVKEPNVSLYLIDKMVAIATYKDITPIVVFTKTDLSSCDELIKIYKNSNIKCYSFSSITKEGLDDIKKELMSKVSVFTGNSGVGKSTLLNNLLPSLDLETGEISDKLGRGKHTTRTVSLYKAFNGYLADTPGFSTLDIERYEYIEKEELQYAFPEFKEYLGKCYFNSCLHTVEKGCKILEIIENGNIEKSRHDSYLKMFEEVKDIKPWNNK